MKRKYIYTQQMLARVADFGMMHAKLFPQETVAGSLLQSIGAAVTKLDGHAGSQISGHGAVRTSAISRHAARKILQRKLEQIARTAQALNVGKFFIPRSRSDGALIATGEGFAEQAESMKKEFIEQGLSENFVEGLKTAVDDLKQALVNTKTSLGQRKATITGFQETLAGALEDLKRFDALVNNTLRENPGIMTQWKTARRVDRIPVAKKEDAPEATVVQ